MAENYGMCDGPERVITIDSGITDQTVIDHTLFHEALHACLSVTGLTSMLSTEVEESIVTCVENTFRTYIKLDKFTE